MHLAIIFAPGDRFGTWRCCLSFVPGWAIGIAFGHKENFLVVRLLAKIRVILQVTPLWPWSGEYRAVGNYYLRYTWEYFMRKNMHNIFLYCGQPEYFRQFLLFVGQDQLGEDYLTYCHIWGSQNTLGKNMHYIFRIFRPLQINHVCDNFHPHGIAKGPLPTPLFLPTSSPLSDNVWVSFW